ncbi:MAG: hypothetical protein RLZZ436_916, partial [Planctomycetota bacterium]
RDVSNASPGLFTRGLPPGGSLFFPQRSPSCLPTLHTPHPPRLTSHFSLLTSHFSLLISHLPLTTYHLPLTTCHLPLTTSHLSLPLSCPRSPIPRSTLYPQATARRLTAYPHPSVFQPGGRHIRCGAVSRRTTPPALPTPERTGGSPRLRFRTLVRTASASRHQPPLPAGYRQAAHRAFSLLSTLYPLPSTLSRSVAEAPGYTSAPWCAPLPVTSATRRQGSLPAGSRPAAHCSSHSVLPRVSPHFSLSSPLHSLPSTLSRSGRQPAGKEV